MSTKTENTALDTAVRAHIASISDEAREDIRADRWDEVMTDALYSVLPELERVDGQTEAEFDDACRKSMAEARRLAAEIVAEDYPVADYSDERQQMGITF